MKKLIRLLMFVGFVILGGVAVIKLIYKCSWKESFEIADQFVAEILS